MLCFRSLSYHVEGSNICYSKQSDKIFLLPKKQRWNGVSAFWVFSPVETPSACRSVDRSRPCSQNHQPVYLKSFSKQLLVRKMQMRMSNCKLLQPHLETSCGDWTKTSSQTDRSSGSSVLELGCSVGRKWRLLQNDIAVSTSGPQSLQPWQESAFQGHSCDKGSSVSIESAGTTALASSL